jgi:phosphoglycolate phosphatase-like HAD superfamily hydrolase
LIALFWDLDGTLLLTGRAGLYAYEDAVLEVTGRKMDFAELKTAGMTDAGVAYLVLREAGVEPTAELAERVLRSYERRLPEVLPRREGRVLDGVREVLDDLEGRDDVRSFLLTGNTPDGARAKLSHYDLWRFFEDRDGAFCVDHGPRTDIARRAVALAPDADELYVIGDTPADIEAGKAIDARTIAVAAGWHTKEELEEHDPWVVLERIPEPAEFRRLIGLD